MQLSVVFFIFCYLGTFQNLWPGVLGGSEEFRGSLIFLAPKRGLFSLRYSEGEGLKYNERLLLIWCLSARVMHDDFFLYSDRTEPGDLHGEIEAVKPFQM